MLMGFIGFGSPPPAPPSSDEPPGDEGGDDTGIRVAPPARAAMSRYRRGGSAVGRYAWAISLGIHGIVLLGAFMAMKYYFRPPAAPRQPTVVEDAGGTGSIMESADATDAVHGGLTITLLPDRVPDNISSDGVNLPSFVRGEPRTISTLTDLAPGSGVDGLQTGLGILPTSSLQPPPRRASSQTQPSGSTIR